jgi:cell division inhibitor SulA/protein ImuA
MAATSPRDGQLQALLRHPSLWRGRDAAVPAGWPTGFEALDAALPGGGWPRRGLIEVVAPGPGHGELTLFAPLLRRLFHEQQVDRCAAFFAPPFELFAPAWRAQGLPLAKLLVVRAPEPLWALEQGLLSGVCAIAFGWVGAGVSLVALRRLVLAAEQGGALGVLIRPLRTAREPTAALLRVAIARTSQGFAIELLKGRGLAPRRLELELS